jgi:two-component system response regulator PilR (NtrC family)
VRELENAIERAVALERSERIQLQALPTHLQAGRPATPVPIVGGSLVVEQLPGPGFNLEHYLQDLERSHVERALKQTGGVQVRAAELLGLSFRQFRYLVKKYGVRA